MLCVTCVYVKNLVLFFITCSYLDRLGKMINGNTIVDLDRPLKYIFKQLAKSSSMPWLVLQI